MFARYFIRREAFLAFRPMYAYPSESPFLHANRVGKRFAGHSKWANILPTKTQNDKKKSLITNKYVRKIREAVRATMDPNPSTNSVLRSLVSGAKSENIPSKVIEEAIRQGMRKEGAQTFPFYFAGQLGISSIVEVSANELSEAARVAERVQSVLKKTGFKLNKYPQNLYKQLGIVIARPVDNEVAHNKAMEDAITCNFAEVRELDNGNFEFQCSAEELSSCTKNLMDCNYDIEHSQVEYEFEKYVHIDNEDILNSFKKLEEKLTNFDGYVRIIYNIE